MSRAATPLPASRDSPVDRTTAHATTTAIPPQVQGATSTSSEADAAPPKLARLLTAAKGLVGYLERAVTRGDGEDALKPESVCSITKDLLAALDDILSSTKEGDVSSGTATADISVETQSTEESSKDSIQIIMTIEDTTNLEFLGFRASAVAQVSTIPADASVLPSVIGNLWPIATLENLSKLHDAMEKKRLSYLILADSATTFTDDLQRATFLYPFHFYNGSKFTANTMFSRLWKWGRTHIFVRTIYAIYFVGVYEVSEIPMNMKTAHLPSEMPLSQINLINQSLVGRRFAAPAQRILETQYPESHGRILVKAFGLTLRDWPLETYQWLEGEFWWDKQCDVNVHRFGKVAARWAKRHSDAKREAEELEAQKCRNKRRVE
uniref:Uncharacterized protein n=1 Tax=Mycena chlorophos TaxID=658473 RepID=A0ABQ0LU64_MYCCL|nr:predicted protein [Mycena chlorophos]